MKLSEAILLGSVGTEQAFCSLYSILKGKAYTCAIGAALFAASGKVNFTRNRNGMQHAAQLWKWAAQPRRGFTFLTSEFNGVWSNVSNFKTNFCVIDEIVLLNDAKRWTRPQIAEWVKSIEPDEVQHDTNLSCPDTHEVPTSQVS